MTMDALPSGAADPAPAGEPAEQAGPTVPEAVDLQAIKSELLGSVDRDLAQLSNDTTDTDDAEPDIDAYLNEEGVDETEREGRRIEVDEWRRRQDDLETENWLLQRQIEHGPAAEAFRRILEADDPYEQFAVLKDIFDGQAAAPPDDSDLSDQVGDIDRNNAAPHVPNGTPVMSDGTVLDKEFRQTFLRNLGNNWPGSDGW